jgi:hypothetical protein
MLPRLALNSWAQVIFLLPQLPKYLGLQMCATLLSLVHASESVLPKLYLALYQQQG